MADAPEPYDLDALMAERKPRKPFTFRFDGETYTLPARIDVRAAAAMQNGDLHAGLRHLLGAEQWARIDASAAVFDTETLEALMDRYGDHIQASMGESSASTGSSGSTGRPSKRTSSASTPPTLVR